jgi:phospholipid/cholesterol/gamma-HCH transport system substrate-binding protein
LNTAKRHNTNILTVLAGVTFVVAVVVGLMFWGGFWTLDSTYDVSVFVPNAQGMADGATVTIAGLPVGQVTSIKRDGPDAILSLRLTSGPTPLPSDSTAAVSLRTLVGESYVQIFVGHARTKIPSGGSLPVSQGSTFVDVDQILSSLGGATSKPFQGFFEGLGGALAGQGPQLNQVVGSAASLISDSAPLTYTLAHEHEQVGQLVANLGDVMAAIGQRTTAVEQFARGAKGTFQAIAARDTALGNLLEQLPSMLVQTRQTSQVVQRVSPIMAPVLSNLARALSDISPAVHALRPASTEGVTLLRSLGGAAPQLRNVLEGLNGLSAPTVAAMPELHATLCQLNPILKYASPYGEDLAAIFQNFGSAGNPYDAGGHGARALESLTTADAGGIAPASVIQAEQTLLGSGLFAKLNQTGFDPFPLPGEINQTVRGRGIYGPASAKNVFTYTHVTAGDC